MIKKSTAKIISLVMGVMLTAGVISNHSISVKANDEEYEVRARIAKEYDLLEWVDEEMYFKDEFYHMKGDDFFVDDLIKLMKFITQDELDQQNELLNQSNRSLFTIANTMENTVETFDKLYHSSGQMSSSAFTINTEYGLKRAFCIQHGIVAPAAGDLCATPEIDENELLRKVLYYGYGGPESLQEEDVDFLLLTGVSASGANGVFYGVYAESISKEFLEILESYEAPPEEFTVWTMETNGGKTQTLSFWTIEEPVDVEIYSEALDFKTKEHIGLLEEDSCIVDQVYYENLVLGKQYELVGYLVNKETGEYIMNGEEYVEGRHIFEAQGEAGIVENYLYFDGTSLMASDIVVYEYLYDESGMLIAIDEDMENLSQTVSYEEVEPEEPELPEEEEEDEEEPEEEEEPKEDDPEEEIYEEEKGGGSNPKTGDTSDKSLFLITSILSLMVGGSALYKRRKML